MKKEYKPVKLEAKDQIFYRFLEISAKTDPNKWFSKEEILKILPQYFKRDENTHDICAALNISRLRLNRARAEGRLEHLVLLKSHKFKLATSREEVHKYCDRDLQNGLKLLKRYWQNVGILKEDGLGQLIDKNGNVIDDDTLVVKFNNPFGGEE